MLCCTFGFDALAGGVVMGIVEFRRDFGHPFAGDYIVDADWQLGFQAATLFGIVGGGLLAGLAINRFGRQTKIAGAYAMSIGGTFLQVFASTPAEFFGGKVLTGIVSSLMCPTLVDESGMRNARPRWMVVSLTQFC
jgi:MFS family permease